MMMVSENLLFPEARTCYLFTMPLSAAEALEVFSTELACDMLEVTILLLSFLDIGSHVVDLVSDEAVPIFAIHVTLLAVKVCWVAFLVVLHFKKSVEAVLAAFQSASDRFLLVRHAKTLPITCFSRRLGQGGA
jgi:hypothetical protein